MTGLSPFDEGYVPPPPPEPKPEPAAPRGWTEPTHTSAPKRSTAKPSAPRAKPVEDDDADDEPGVEYPTEIADGIYFGMIDDAYHAIERLSVSGMQRLMVSAATFWADSWLNPDRKEKPAKFRTIGRAYHAARLEPHVFTAGYVRMLDKADMPKGTPITGTDMAAELVKLDLPKSGSVAEQAARLRAGGYRGPIWQLELEAWEEARQGRVPIDAKTYAEIVEDGERLRASPKIAELLSDGVAEVSIFWTCPKTGIPMKARLDYLKPRTWVDLKTFDNTRGKRLEQAIADAFRYNRYYVQAVGYRDAVEAIRNGLVDLVGEATEEQRKVLAEVQMSPRPLDCYYVFQEKSGVPNILARRFLFDDLPPLHTLHAAGLDERQEAAAAGQVGRATAIARKAVVEIAHAKKVYLAYSEIYERGEPWIPFDPVADIGDDDFPQRWLEGAD